MCRKGRSTFISVTAVECVRWTHGINIERNNLLCEQTPTEVFRSIFAWLVTLNLVLKAMDGGRDASAAVDKSITGEGVHRHDGRVA